MSTAEDFKKPYVLALTLALLTGCSRTRPEDLKTLESVVAPAHGTWIFLSGRHAIGDPAESFFFDAHANTFLSAEVDIASAYLTFSADGHHAAWWMKQGSFFVRKRYRLVTARLEPGRASLRRLDVAANEPSAIAISPDGSLLAFGDNDSVSVVSTVNGASPVAIRLPHFSNPPALFFPSSERLRAYSLQPNLRAFHAGTSDTLVEIDVPARHAVVTGVITYDFPGPRFRPRCDGAVALVLERRRTKITLRAGHTGREIVRLRTVEGEPDLSDETVSPIGKLRSAAFLTRDRVLAVLKGHEGSTLRLFSTDGTILWTSKVDIPPGDVALGAASDDRLLVSLMNQSRQAEGYVNQWAVLVVDATTGKELSRVRGLRPLDQAHFWAAPCLSELGEATANRDRLFLNAAGGLVRLDSSTGATRPVLP